MNYQTPIGVPRFESLDFHYRTENALFLDVSIDYIYGRTDKPQVKRMNITLKSQRTARKCSGLLNFDPDSPMNEQLKQTLIEMLREAKN